MSSDKISGMPGGSYLGGGGEGTREGPFLFCFNPPLARGEFAGLKCV